MIVFCMASGFAQAQKFPPPFTNIGDDAPLLRVQRWLKGTPVTRYEKGKIYVISFWATWCKPCRAEMPRLSAISRKYKGAVSVIDIDIYERSTTTLQDLQANTDSLDYTIAIADTSFTEKDWLIATGEFHTGIPIAFIVDRNGKLAWAGHPCDNFEESLAGIINNNWDNNIARANKILEFRLRNLDDSLTDQLEFAPDGNFRSASWKRDSGMLLIDEWAKTIPLIKFTPRIAYQLFFNLLNNDIPKACVYGRKVLETSTYDAPAAMMIRGAIENAAEKIKLPPEVYQLGIDAIKVQINDILSCFPELKNVSKHYYKMSEWYWHLANRSKAVEALEKAIEITKTQAGYSARELTVYNVRLRQYKTK